MLVEAWPVSGPISKVWNPLLDQLAWTRNEELLRRLRGMVEHRRHPLGV